MKTQYKRFKNCTTFQKYIRQGKYIPDAMIVDNILFTQDEYDMSGKQITYGNKLKQKTLYIETENRYETREDAKVYIEDFLFERIGFPYRQ